MKNGLYTMKEVCDNVGMTYETLKFYCNKGLVPNIKRNENNHRVFDENDLKWISSLSCLKKCGMSIKESSTTWYQNEQPFLKISILPPFS